jgi:23S rRNA (cytidine1920-2'-O)/16S rRNA (cytidine1409-2'-O)-methyltransferase
MEKTNIRYVTPDDIGEKADFVSIDVSFISLLKVLSPVKELMKQDSRIVCLIKPQFEAGREKVGKKGVVREAATHEEVINGIIQFTETFGWRTVKLSFSPITGPEGNIEFLAEIRHRKDDTPMISGEEVSSIVEEAHRSMGKSRK